MDALHKKAGGGQVSSMSPPLTLLFPSPPTDPTPATHLP